ncbi:hypothetical protein OC842_001735 [Tilletia horrida]|uniref:Uncharacterized protein n=1 Tax=Tilletia horrida TaxID=155126 RepID=A0AAN6GEG9_9BASI|nr:hypothetical protein OC842_001735 [Tilletia horrida]
MPVPSSASAAAAASADPISATPAPVVQSPLATLLAFRDVQRKRAEYWIEYQDAIDAHFRWTALTQQRTKLQLQLQQEAEDDAASGVVAPSSGSTARTQHSCAHAAGIDTSSLQDLQEEQDQAQKNNKEQEKDAPEVNGPMLLQIVNLVTQGLLSCSHQTRMLEAHLRDPRPPPSGEQEQEPSTTDEDSPAPPRPDLAKLLATVQEGENRLLRTTVKRDQLRTAALHGTSAAPHTSAEQAVNDTAEGQVDHDDVENVDGQVARLQRERDQIREEINEAMAEVQAEIAELQLQEG